MSFSAENLEKILQAMGLSLNEVVLMEVPREVLLGRLAGRRECRDCGTRYQGVSDSPTETNQCRQCGGELQPREDDREETITTRLNVYDTETAPLANYYRERGKLREIDAVGTVDEIHRRITETLEKGAAG